MPLVNPHSSVSWKSWALLLAVFGLFAWILLSPSRLEPSERVRSVRNISKIADALALYREEHSGELPSSLLELVPDYVSKSDVAIFLPPRDRDQAKVYAQSLERILANTAYLYLGQDGVPIDIVLCEKPDLWEDRSDLRSVELAAVNPELNLVYYSREELRRLLRLLRSSELKEATEQ
jgi:hypothetical protein